MWCLVLDSVNNSRVKHTTRLCKACSNHTCSSIPEYAVHEILGFGRGV